MLSHSRCAQALARLLGVLALWLSFASGVGAQERMRESVEYRNAVRDALSEFDVGNWEEAQALFERAHAISPSARTLRGIGFCLFERRHYVEAVDQLRRALDADANALTGATRESAQRLLERAQGFIAHVPLNVTPNAASVAVDGRAALFESGQLLLDPGEHELALRAAGYEPRTLRVEVTSGVNEGIDVELRALELGTSVPEAAATQHAAPVAQVSDDKSTQRATVKRRLTVAGAVVLGVSAVSAAVTGGVALKQGRDLQGQCPNNECPPGKRGELQTARALALISNISIGVVAVGAGLCLTGILLPTEEDQRAHASVRVGPMSVAVNGRF